MEWITGPSSLGGVVTRQCHCRAHLGEESEGKMISCLEVHT